MPTLGPEYVSAREWMRICFELLELLKAHKKAIRRAAVNTFGYIAKAIGPHDVLATLLNNLKVRNYSTHYRVSHLLVLVDWVGLTLTFCDTLPA